MLGDLRGIFLTAESVPSVARFCPLLNLVNSVNPLEDCKRVEISSEPNSHFRACCKLGWTGEVQNENK